MRQWLRRWICQLVGHDWRDVNPAWHHFACARCGQSTLVAFWM